MPSIREFPRYELSESDREQIINRSQSLEQVTVENERYLPLSEMDLRAFSRDLERVLTSYDRRFPGLTLDHVYVVGDSAAHPDLPGLLQQNLNCAVNQVRPLLAEGLRDWSLDEPLLQCSLTRLVGLGLGLLGVDQVDDRRVPTLAQDPVLADQSLAAEFVEAELDTPSHDSQLIPVDALVNDVNQVEDAPASVNEPVVDGLAIAAEGVEEKVVSVVEEDESEWPSLKLDVSEAGIEEEETLVDGVEIVAEGVEEKQWCC